LADLTITATSVVKGTGAQLDYTRVFGETVTAGMPVYLKESDGKYWKSQSDGTSAEAEALGIAINGGAAGQPAVVQTGGQLTIGATVAAGVFYYVSNTAGGICPVADLGTADYVTAICYGISTSVVVVLPVATGVVLA
jgi:hypothetical protein